MRGRRGEMRHLFDEHGIFAVGAYHASHEKLPGNLKSPAEITGFLLTMPFGLIPLAIIVDWLTVKVAWASDLLILRLLFTLPGLVCSLLALIGIIAWIIVVIDLVSYVIHFLCDLFSKRS